MPVVVGVDAGGTRTVAAVERGDDAPAAFVEAGANPNVYGVPAAAETIVTAITRVLNGDVPDAIGVGAAGAGRSEMAHALERALRIHFPAARSNVPSNTAL